MMIPPSPPPTTIQTLCAFFDVPIQENTAVVRHVEKTEAQVVRKIWNSGVVDTEHMVSVYQVGDTLFELSDTASAGTRDIPGVFCIVLWTHTHTHTHAANYAANWTRITPLLFSHSSRSPPREQDKNNRPSSKSTKTGRRSYLPRL